MGSRWETEQCASPAGFFSTPNGQSNQTQPQVQLHAMLPPARKHITVRGYTAEDWNAHRQEITRLYEDNTLERVIELMRERHNLTATAKQYKDRIKKWNLNKNIQPDEMEAIIRKQRQRALENKLSAFRVRKRPVNQEKINRYIKEHPERLISTQEDVDESIDSVGTNPATPAAISCYTPSETGPLTPHAPLSPQTRADEITTQSFMDHEIQHHGSLHIDQSFPNLRRLSIESLLLGPPDSSFHDLVRDVPTWGIDRGSKDLDVGKNDDMNAISDLSPAASRTQNLSNDEAIQFMRDLVQDRNYKPVPIVIPRSLEPLPSALLENPMNLLYFHHYLNNTADCLVLHSCRSNPFRTVLPQMAMQDRNLLNLLLACSASHRASILDQPAPSIRIALWVQDIFPNLRHALDDRTKIISNSKLATAILFTSLEIISPNAFGVPIPWQMHLGLASQMITARGGPQKMQNRDDKVSSFLWSWFAYLDVLGRLSGGSPNGDSFSSEWILNYEIDEEDECQIDCILGFTPQCLQTLSEIAVLARICDRERVTCDGFRTHWKPSEDIVDRAVKLEADLTKSLARPAKCCKHKRDSRDIQEAEDQSDQLGMEATNKAFHWACLVHLHRRLLGKSSKHFDVQDAIQNIMDVLCKVERGSTSEACMLFPMFTAGCDALDEKLRSDILERIKGVERFGTMQTRRARTLMRRVWETGMPWEMLVTDEFLG